jgi:outer membrane protein TolC
MLRSRFNFSLQRSNAWKRVLVASLVTFALARCREAQGDDSLGRGLTAVPAIIGGLDIHPTTSGQSSVYSTISLPMVTQAEPFKIVDRPGLEPPATSMLAPPGFGVPSAQLEPVDALRSLSLDPLQEPQQDPIAWWNQHVIQAQLGSGSAIGLSLDQLFVLAATHSARVQAISQQPMIAEAQVGQALAAFDPVLFSNNRFDGTSEPAESTLITGGPPRLEDNILGLDSGLQGQLRNGASYAMSQRFGLKDSNSTFFIPGQQGNSRLRASLNYPLLRGRRIDLPRSLLLTATFESHAAQAEFSQQFQAHLHSIAETYWRLYQERAAYVQRQRHLSRALEIAERIEHRSQYDLQRSQWLRVKATVTNRRAELVNIQANIRNLESQLRAQVNAPEIIADRGRELLTIQEPQVLRLSLNMETEVAKALASRPELAELQHRLQSARVRLQLAKDQLKPQLNVVTEAYLAGLREDFDMGRAFTDSFGDRPGYAAGLAYEQPLRRRAATQAVQQRTLEVSQLSQLVREAEENIRTEVEIALRNIAAAEATAVARYESVEAALADLEQQYDRWLNLGEDPRVGQIQLSELLAAQDRLLQEETGLLEATIQFSRSYLEYLRALGALVVLN